MIHHEAWHREADERDLVRLMRKWSYGDVQTEDLLPFFRRLPSPPAMDLSFRKAFVRSLGTGEELSRVVEQVPWIYQVVWEDYLEGGVLEDLPKSFVLASPEEHSPQLSTSHTFTVVVRDPDNYKQVEDEGSLNVSGDHGGGSRPLQSPRQILQELVRVERHSGNSWSIVTTSTHDLLTLDFPEQEYGEGEVVETRGFYVREVSARTQSTWLQAFSRWLAKK